MEPINLIPIFMIGLLGSVHCVGMCGGVVAAFSSAPEPQRRFPVAVVTASASVSSSASASSASTSAALVASGFERVTRVLAYNAGRIASYAAAGAIAGGLAGGVGMLGNVAALQSVGYWLANLMLVALGLYLMDMWRGITWLEGIGQSLWRHVMPLMKYLLPLDNPLKVMLLGGLWGWLPCGMVYSMLTTAMFSGSALSGAMVMVAFGLGTLPTLMTMGLLGAQIKRIAQRRPVRLASGLIVLGFGILGLVRAAHPVPMGWLDSLCVSAASAVRVAQ